MRLCAVLVTYNRKELLEQSIEALLDQDSSLCKIIVMDNASTDGTNHLFVEHGKYSTDSRMEYHRLEQNIGGSGGFHMGIKEAIQGDYDWILVLDDDAILEKGFVEKMEKAILRYPEVSCFTGNVRWYSKGAWRNTQESKEEYLEVNRVTFVGAVIKKTLIEQIGLPERDFFIWYDDTEYSMRMRKVTKILCVIQASIVHMQKEETDRGINWKKFYGIRNYIIVQMKYLPNRGIKVAFVFGYYIKFTLSCLIKQLLIDRDFHQFKTKIRLGYTAISDGIRNKQGLHPDYQPGKPLGGVK